MTRNKNDATTSSPFYVESLDVIDRHNDESNDERDKLQQTRKMKNI